MLSHPYEGLPVGAFWKTGVAEANPSALDGIYTKKFPIPANARIATAGSCFAQHVSRQLRKHGYEVLDVEPPPVGLPDHLHQAFGYSMYSARYGNIYTVRQFLQLVQEAAGRRTPANAVWERDGRFFDALRPAVEPTGLDSPEEVTAHRRCHVTRVRELFERFDLLILTLGLTEMWVDKKSGTVYPTAPGTIAGVFDERSHEFQNARFGDIIDDFNGIQEGLVTIRGGRPFGVILTVSPIPLTATASGGHVLASTAYSKATLRAVAGELATTRADVDYFPAYEIATNPRLRSAAFTANLRSMTDEAVEIVMGHFFAEHPPRPVVASTATRPAPGHDGHATESLPLAESRAERADVACEEMILEAFAPSR